MGLMIMPMVCSLSEDALRAVPRSLREAGYALGSTKYDVSSKSSCPPPCRGSWLRSCWPWPGDWRDDAGGDRRRQLTANDAQPTQQYPDDDHVHREHDQGGHPSGTIEYKSLYAVALCLFVMTFLMNVISHKVMRRYREVYH